MLFFLVVNTIAVNVETLNKRVLYKNYDTAQLLEAFTIALAQVIVNFILLNPSEELKFLTSVVECQKYDIFTNRVSEFLVETIRVRIDFNENKQAAIHFKIFINYLAQFKVFMQNEFKICSIRKFFESMNEKYIITRLSSSRILLVMYTIYIYHLRVFICGDKNMLICMMDCMSTVDYGPENESYKKEFIADWRKTENHAGCNNNIILNLDKCTDCVDSLDILIKTPLLEQTMMLVYGRIKHTKEILKNIYSDELKLKEIMNIYDKDMMQEIVDISLLDIDEILDDILLKRNDFLINPKFQHIGIYLCFYQDDIAAYIVNFWLKLNCNKEKALTKAMVYFCMKAHEICQVKFRELLIRKINAKCKNEIPMKGMSINIYKI